MYPQRFIITTFIVFCLMGLLPLLPAAAADDPIDMAQNNPSGLSSSYAGNAASPRLPSGQGANLNESKSAIPSPEPLYVPGGQAMPGGRPFSGSPAWTQQGYDSSRHFYPPFGANLFQGYFAGTYYDGMNQNYTIMPGDRILVRIWGEQSYTDTLMVDQQGNIFLPEVGPVRVAGIRHGDLQKNMRSYLASVFKTNMEIYADLLTAQPVAVYVTGFVARPGRYAGGMNDSALYYLDRAGGIIPERGTYRDIEIKRNNRTIARVDLYSFILDGSLPGGMVQDNDVIVVGPKKGSVVATGLIPQHASYESKGKWLSGAELTHFAAPLSSVSHVSITGTRNAAPFHVYMPLREFAKFTLSSDDRVEFLADKPSDTIMVTVTGATVGATRYPIKRNAKLRDLLAHVPVDPALSNLSGIYLKRRSVAIQQRKAIADALHRLENSVLTATSESEGGAGIRVKEAELVQNFVQRASTLEPDGVVVVTRKGVTSDIMLEEGDEVVIPQNSDVVQISGEVMIPKAVVYSSGQGTQKYVQDAGGFTNRADSDNILVVHANGEVTKASGTSIQSGDLLLVMPRYDSKGLPVLKDIMQVLYQVAIATKVVTGL